MIRFFYRAGSTRTRRYLTDQIKKDLAAGREVLLLVPEQETVSVERRMLQALSPADQLSFEVVNFSRLANKTFRKLGGLFHRSATPAVSALVMWQTVNDLVKREALQQFGGRSARDSALCDLMLQTEAQCKAACISPEQLREAATKLKTKAPPLYRKLSDIANTLSAYEGNLGARFENSKDELHALAELLKKGRGRRLYADTHFYVDSFTDFTVQELHILEALLDCAASVSVAFPLRGPRDTGLHLKTVANTHRLLLEAAEKKRGMRVSLKACLPATSETAITYLSRHLFHMSAKQADAGLCRSDAVRLTSCPTPFDEAAAAAAEIHRLVRRGCRYGDIAVVVREAESWVGILDAAFEREGIPYYLSEKADVTLRPLIKLITEALRIHQTAWREEDVVGYLKTGLCGVCEDDLNLFEEYVHVWHPRGQKAYTGAPFDRNPDGFSSECTERGARILAAANRVREAIAPPLTALFAALESAPNATAMCQALYAFLERLNVREQLKQEAKGLLTSKGRSHQPRLKANERREAEELSRLYGVTLDALETLSLAIGDRALTVAEFADALKAVFSRTDIGSIPTSTDEVTVGSASMLRTDHPEYVLVLGLNEGLFPKSVKDDGLLSDADKRRLKELQVEFPSTAGKMASDELFYLHRAISAPTNGLRLFYSVTGTDGRKLEPSIAVTRVKALLGESIATSFAAVPPIERIYTPGGAVELMPELSQEQRKALMACPEMQEMSAAKSLDRPVIDRTDAIPQAEAEALFAKGDRYSPTHLERFSFCHFAYYCEKVLKLREEPSSSISTAEVGNFIHHVLEQIMLAVQKSKGKFDDFDKATREALIAQICQNYRAALAAAGSAATPRTEALMDRLASLARVIVTALFAEFKDSSFTPAFMELDLKRIGNTPTVTLKDGTEVPLSGKVDRVDVWHADKKRVYLRVTDYKTGVKSFAPEDIEKGFCLQMPLYLMALCRGRHEVLCDELGVDRDTELLPAGVCYLSSAIEVEKTESPIESDAALAAASERLSRKGITPADEAVRNAISHTGSKAVLGSGKGTVTLSDGEFKDMFDSLERSIGQIVEKMKSGDANARPQFHDKKSPCDYCAFAAVCRGAKKIKD